MNQKIRKAVPSELEDRIRRAINGMEAPDYRFPRRFGRKDYIAVALVAAGCLAMILIGATL